jgi:hypothetical protein
MGSAGAKVISVVRDVTDAYVHAGGQYEWDSAAPVAVARAAGLHTSRIDGSPLVYNQRDVLLPDLVVCRPELAADVDRLYRGEFHAHDDDSDWARTEREHLLRVRQEMLTEAALAALELRRFREALDFASSAVDLDWTAETPHRALMRAHAGLGEIGSALRVFETYRAHLAEELGADPSRQTLDLHLRLLRSSRS